MDCGVFINYRGEDSHSYGALLYTELARKFGEDRVFLDCESIPAGADFVEELLGRVQSARVLLAVIGPRWLTATDPPGQRRIDNPADWIRRELAEAFAAGVRVIPVLTEQVKIPAEADLPADIAALSRCQYRRLRHHDATTDLARIVTDLTSLDPTLAASARRRDDAPRQFAPPSLFTRRRRVWLWVGLIGIGAGALVLLGWAYLNSVRPGLPQLVGIVLTQAFVLFGVFSQWMRRPSAVEPDDALVRAADRLAATIHDQWVAAAAERRLLQPAPIAVRWRWSRRSVTGSAQDAIGSPHGYQWFSALPGMPVATADMVDAGEIGDLAGVYSALGSGRLVILGGPGTGKTAAAILMLVHNLEYRQSLAEMQRTRVPIPVLLTPHEWDPHHQRLGDWLTDQLCTDYPFLMEPRYGPEAAARLVRQRYVALFLDGFDEITPALRQAAVEVLDEQATFRLVVTTRPDEFANAVGTQHLHGAAALELQPVPAADAAEYLTRCQLQPLPREWQRLVDYIRERPDSAVASALDSPLTLSLIRDAFRVPHEVDDLLHPTRFSTRAEVEDYLLAKILPTAYKDRPGQPPGRYSLEQARRWLGYIASRMNGQRTRDLAWWRVHRWVSPFARILTAGLMVAVTTGVVLGLADAAVFEAGDGDGIAIGLLGGLGIGAIGGVAAGLASERREPSSQRRGATRWSAPTARFNPVVGLFTGLAVGITACIVLSEEPQFGFVLGFPGGLGIGLVSGATAGLASAVTPRRRAAVAGRDGLRWDQLTKQFNLAVGIAAGLPAGLSLWLTKGGLQSGLPDGIAFVIAFGFLDGFLKGSMSAAIPATPLASWRQNRTHARYVGVAFGVSIGLAVAFTVGPRTALGHGLFVGVVSGALVGLAAGLGAGLAVSLAVSETWLTTLAFLQLWSRGVMPYRGMRFLNDAHQRGVLRTVGPVYQFRHARLQDQLANTMAMTNKPDQLSPDHIRTRPGDSPPRLCWKRRGRGDDRASWAREEV